MLRINCPIPTRLPAKQLPNPLPQTVATHTIVMKSDDDVMPPSNTEADNPRAVTCNAMTTGDDNHEKIKQNEDIKPVQERMRKGAN